MHYHTFISYNSKNIADAWRIYQNLANSGLKVFFDKKCIAPGAQFQRELEEGLKSSGSILVLVGDGHVGPWQEQETYMFQIIERAHKENRPIIPIFLTGASFNGVDESIPYFLRQYNGIALTNTNDEPAELFKIIQAIPRAICLLHEYERPLLDNEQDQLMRDTVHFYNENAERYYDRWRNVLPIGAIGAFLQRVNQSGKNKLILDAGCGPGHHAAHFAAAGNKILGLDLSQNFITLANKQYKNTSTSFMRGDLRVLHEIIPTRNHFDAIWACGSCVHMAREALERQLYEFLAVLKPNGILGLSLQVETPSVIQDDGRFFERYEQQEINKKVESIGYNIVNVNYDINNHSTTTDKMKIKKWYNIVAISPSSKGKVLLIPCSNRATVGPIDGATVARSC